jgi:vacuolar-type H+-ATPase subunit B/Vma2
MISSWWDLLFTSLIFVSGIEIGKLRFVNEDITKQTEHMQDLIDQAYKKRDHMKKMWIDAEEKAESWERRYLNLCQLREKEFIESNEEASI